MKATMDYGDRSSQARRQAIDVRLASQGLDVEGVDVEEVSGTINTLIETCMDGQRLFSYASVDVHEAELRQRLLAYASQRAAFARELQITVLRLGGNPANDGSLSGKLLQGWMDVKSAAAVRETYAVLQEVERGEDLAVARFQKALRCPLPDEVRDTLHRMLDELHKAHDDIHVVRDSYRAIMH